MIQNITVHVVFFMAIFSVTTHAADVSPLLQRNNWEFTQEELAKLNSANVTELDDTITKLIAKTTGNLPTGVLIGFKVVDLNDDGISEIIARVDVSGRGLLRDVTIISRNDGVYHYDTIPAYGGMTQLWKSDKEQLLVTSQPACDLSRSDPLITYPLLYSWTGLKCKDVSKQARAYYETSFLPSIKESLERAKEAAPTTESREDKLRRVLRIVGLSRALVRVNNLFDKPLFSRSEVADLKKTLESLDLSSEDDLRGTGTPLLHEARGMITAEMSRLTHEGY